MNFMMKPLLLENTHLILVYYPIIQIPDEKFLQI